MLPHEESSSKGFENDDSENRLFKKISYYMWWNNSWEIESKKEREELHKAILFKAVSKNLWISKVFPFTGCPLTHMPSWQCPWAIALNLFLVCYWSGPFTSLYLCYFFQSSLKSSMFPGVAGSWVIKIIEHINISRSDLKFQNKTIALKSIRKHLPPLLKLSPHLLSTYLCFQ